MDNRTHLNTDDLILFMDRELEKEATSAAERHLLACAECGNRLRALQNGSAAYVRYQEQVLKPALQTPQSGWAPLAQRLQPKPRMNWGIWWTAAAFAATLALIWFYLPLHNEPGAQEILDKAERAPETVRGDIVFTTGKLRFARPAVMESASSQAGYQHVRTLFVQANYSWADPLSARSFAAWRRQLREKRDSITAIREEDGRRFYRIRTRTDAGMLTSAALTLEAVTYHPAQARFEFRGEDPVEISEQANEPRVTQTAPPVSPPPAKVEETPAGPEDELRVFAALDALGADAEDPIDVKLDAGRHNVLVTGMGMPPARRKQIEAALAALPRTVVRFSAAHPPAENPTIPPATSEPARSSFLENLQQRAGGARTLQNITDQSLETSTALFAQSHALLVLAQEFPPPVEALLNPDSTRILLALRQRHLGAMAYAIRHLRDQLRPLLPEDALVTQTASAASWQTEAETLYESSRNLDRLLNRLLAGSYDEETGELMLKQLPESISKVEALILSGSR
jgi:hypothetical protein